MDLNIINDEEKFLARKLEGYTLKGGENKFDDKGNPLPYPGCTIICNIPLNTYLSDQIISYQKKIEKFNPENTYFYLPSSSFHMTLFDCCNLNTKNTKYWPTDIDPDMDYKDIAIELNKRIQNYIFPEELNLKLKMFFGGYSIVLEPFSEKDEKILRNCRDELSSLLKIKFENHQRYTFHITLAYILRELNKNEIKSLIEYNKKLFFDFSKKFPKIILTKPEMCTFEDMLEFKNINQIF
ncbi:DUF1868 domain-containing protein [Candidatus Pelagibacter sp.]|nr:DUF1868 domain-containing protein [Candidatus Pelagibacter sp.]MDC0853200.1 DUF1868 domain-containing protein [Candidatus Pelagibacter sp.]